MRVIVPTEGFTAYPNDKRTHFKAGEPVEVSNDLAEQLEAKGLVTIQPASKNEGKGRKPQPDEMGVAATMPDAYPEPVVTTD